VGITNTHDLVARTFLWSGLRADVKGVRGYTAISASEGS
jgi:hypothetical protein